jgi:predicted  nucleic acid-binding Zn-ribbon protein
MNNEFGNAPANQPKDNRTLIYGILIGLLLVTWGYIIYDKSKTKEEITTLSNQATMVTNERDEIKELYNASLVRLDSLMGENQSLADSMDTRNSEVAKLKSEIRKILGNSNATKEDLAKARRMIGDLNGQIETLSREVNRLKGENRELTTTNQRITEEKQQVEQNLATTSAEKEAIQKNLDETMDVAGTLKASNIAIMAINEKSGGKEKETTTAKKVDKLRVTFDLDPNRLAKNGQKEIYVSVTSPDGSPISKGNFSTREEGQKFYTSVVPVDYDNTRKAPVSFDLRNESGYKTGDYKIEIYHNGFKIGEGTRSLKKSGLF